MPTESGEKSLITFMQAVEDMGRDKRNFNRSTQCMILNFSE